MFVPINPFSGLSRSGSAISALTPQITVVSPSLTKADPSAVEIEPAQIDEKIMGEKRGLCIIPTFTLTSLQSSTSLPSGLKPSAKNLSKYARGCNRLNVSA